MEGSSLDKGMNKIIQMDKKILEIKKKFRKKKRARKKGYIDRENEQEGGESYISGNFLKMETSMFSNQPLFTKLVIIQTLISQALYMVLTLDFRAIFFNI